MSKKTFSALAVICGFCLGAANGLWGRESSPAGTTNGPVRLVLELKDGSRVEGRPARTEWPLQTELAGAQKMSLRLISSMELTQDLGAKVNFKNGDRLTVKIGLEQIQLQTAFGEVKIVPELIRTIRVLSGNGGRHALKFNLANRVEIANDPQLQFGSAPFTISFWFKTESDRSCLSFISKRSSAYGDGWVVHEDHGQLLFYCAGCCSPKSPPVKIRDGQWHHLVVVRNDSLISFYLDGKNAGCGDTRCNHFDSNPLRLGMDASDNTWHFEGELSEVHFYRRALSTDEVAEEWNNGAGITAAVAGGGLIAGYHLDESQSNTAKDFSGNNHDGTLINNPEWDN